MSGPHARAGSGLAAALRSAAGQRVDRSSLVLGDLADSAWSCSAGILAPGVRQRAGVAADGTRALCLVNAEVNAIAGGYLEAIFTVPVGVTAIKLQLDEVRLDTSLDVSTGAAALELWDSPGFARLSTAAFAPTSTSVTVTTSALSVTEGAEYRVRLAVAPGGAQSRFLCRRIRVMPSASSDAFWLAFGRLHVDSRNLAGNHLRGRDRTPRFDLAASFSRVDLRTSAREVRAELHASGGRYVGTLPGFHDAATALVNGQPIGDLSPAAPIGVSYASVTLPAALGSPLPVSVVTGVQAHGPDEPYSYCPPLGTYLGAIYVPAGSYVETTPIAVRRAVIYGDSKTVSYPARPSAGNLAEVLRARGWEVTLAGIGGGTLRGDIGSATVTLAAVEPLAARLAVGQPDLVVVEMGRNDFVAPYYSGANLVTLIGHLLDALHAALPASTIALATWTHEVTEAAVGGVEWEAERVALVALLASRSTWATLIDLAGLWTSAQAAVLTADTVHPDDDGHARMEREIVRAIVPGTFPHAYGVADMGATAWWEAGAGLVGGAFGSVTAGGAASPPTVVFSGSPTVASRLIVEVRVGGALGVARFDASIDGGQSWPYRGVLTAASVPLSLFGADVAVEFSAGTYGNLHTYYADSGVVSWTDMIGGLSLVGSSAVYVPRAFSSGSRRAHVRLGGNPAKMAITGLSIPQPYTLVVVAQLDDDSSVKAIVGQNGATSAPLIATTSGTQIAANYNAAQFSATVDVETAVRTYALLVDGASSRLYVDGSSSATGTLGAGSLTGFWLGADSVNGYFATGRWYAVGVIAAGITADKAACIASRMRAQYGAA